MSKRDKPPTYFMCEECQTLHPWSVMKEALEAEMRPARWWRGCRVRFYHNMLCPKCYCKLFVEPGISWVPHFMNCGRPMTDVHLGDTVQCSCESDNDIEKEV